MSAYGASRKGKAPTGRTTSPPAPAKREATQPQQAQKVVEGTTGRGLLAKPVGGRGHQRKDHRFDPNAAAANPWEPPRVVELKMQQVITNAATKEQYELGSDETPPHISCVSFDTLGEHMAYGDRAGRCYIFCKSNGRLASLTPNYEPASSGYTLVDVVEAYQPQLDTLNSTEIEAKVNVLRFVNLGNGSLFFLTANDKTIKMFKVWERRHATAVGSYEPVEAILDNWQTLKFPEVHQSNPTIWHKELKVFAADHEYHVNSISTSSNGDNFITADDLTVQLWHLGHHEQSLRIVDRHPEQMEELSETITSAAFHTSSPQEFCVANSKGVVSIYDLRTNLTCPNAARSLPASIPAGPNVYLSTILAGISDVRYSPCGTFIIARDYLNVKVWDARKEDLP
eukprot:gene23308-35685_t